VDKDERWRSLAMDFIRNASTVGRGNDFRPFIFAFGFTVRSPGSREESNRSERETEWQGGI